METIEKLEVSMKKVEKLLYDYQKLEQELYTKENELFVAKHSFEDSCNDTISKYKGDMKSFASNASVMEARLNAIHRDKLVILRRLQLTVNNIKSQMKQYEEEIKNERRRYRHYIILESLKTGNNTLLELAIRQ